MDDKKTNKRINYKAWLVILTVTALAFTNALISVRHWELNQEVNLLSSSISSIVAYHGEKAVQGEEDDSTDKDDGEQKNNQPEEAPKTVLEIKSGGYYYSSQGDQLGIGPLPPEVDIQTNYWVFWEIDSAEGVRDIEITGELPDKVVWTNKKTVTAGSLHFGEVGRRVVWLNNEIDLKSPCKVGFEIGLIPRGNDIGKTMDLLTDIEYQAISRYTGEKISGSLDKITTNLKFDDLASGKGEVVQ
jgi:hypothetical protein